MTLYMRTHKAAFIALAGVFPWVLLFLKCLAGGIAMLMFRIRFKLKDLPLIMWKELGEI
jgi:hypothetical protein